MSFYFYSRGVKFVYRFDVIGKKNLLLCCLVYKWCDTNKLFLLFVCFKKQHSTLSIGDKILCVKYKDI